MSWFSGTNPLDELVEKATDSSLPADSEDLALNLEICDQIRSKTIGSKDAMRSLKKRISNKNPNVQLLALNLTDLCVKNGGSHFLVEIVSREFVDNLVSLLKAPLGINSDVRERLLALIQTWALAFESRPDLSYMMSTYQTLRSEGLQFPPEERVAAAFLDSAAPPDWADSDVCMRCRTAFTFRNRKHHCRNCGNVFCGACSTQTMTLPHLGINEPVRVCNGCYAKCAQANNASKAPSHVRHKRLPSYQQTQNSANQQSAGDTEDLDLKRALELSLAESERAAQSQATPATRDTQRSKAKAVESQEEDDAEFKAAIEASLKESNSHKTEDTYAYPSLQHIGSSKLDSYQPVEESRDTAALPFQTPPQNPLELTMAEQENIKLFATLVDRLNSDRNGAILRDPQIQELYEGIANLRPKLARALGDTVGKYESLVEAHAQLATAVKYYDRLLEARLASTYSNGMQYSENPGPHQMADAQSYYGAGPATYDYAPQESTYDSHQRYSNDHQSSQSISHPSTLDQYNHQNRYAPNMPQQLPEPAEPAAEISLIDL